MIVADTGNPSVPTTGEEHFVVLDADAITGRFFDAHGGRYEWVAFAACGRSWVLSATSTDDGRGTRAGEVRRVAEGLVSGVPDQPEPTGVTGFLYAYTSSEQPVGGPAAGRVVVLERQREVARRAVSGDGRFMLDLPPGDYEIVAVLEDGHPCGQQQVTAVANRVYYRIFTCQRPSEPSTEAAPDERDKQGDQGDPTGEGAMHKQPGPRPCSAAEFPVTARSAQEQYNGDETIRVAYEFTNRSTSPCIFPHRSKMRILNEVGEVVWESMTAIDCPNDECRHIQPGKTRTGGEEWLGTTYGPTSEMQRVPDGFYRAELKFEVEDSRNPQGEPVARYDIATAPFRVSSQ